MPTMMCAALIGFVNCENFGFGIAASMVAAPSTRDAVFQVESDAPATLVKDVRTEANGTIVKLICKV